MISAEDETAEVKSLSRGTGFRRRVIGFARSSRSFVRALWMPLAVLLAGILLQTLAALTPWLTERFYTRLIYPKILAAVCSLSRHFSFSVGEVLIYLLLCAASLLLTGFGILIFLRRSDRTRLVRTGSKLVVWLAASLLWTFLFAFGLNYQRPLLFDLLGYEKRRANAFELEALGGEIVRGVNENYQEAHDGGRALPGTSEVSALLKESFDSAADLALLPRGDFASPKPAYASGLLTRLGISGIYFPYTGEPNYNADAPDFQQPFSMAHEMAHQRGVARESEANFVAYLVCVNSRHPFVRYSGYRNGLGVLSELYRVEPEKAREMARQLGPGYREDSRRAALFWAKAAGTAGALSQRINDLYLRANRVKSGVDDYKNSTTLIIGQYLHETSRGPSTPAQ
jgi:hypothetical protein